RHAHVLLDHLEQLGVLLGRPDFSLRAAGKLQDLERPRGVEALDMGRVDHARLLAGAALGGATRLVDLLLQAAQAEHGPVAADLQDRGAAALDIADGWVWLGHWRD